jgi:hypothetical protein
MYPTTSITSTSYLRISQAHNSQAYRQANNSQAYYNIRISQAHNSEAYIQAHDTQAHIQAYNCPAHAFWRLTNVLPYLVFLSHFYCHLSSLTAEKTKARDCFAPLMNMRQINI